MGEKGESSYSAMLKHKEEEESDAKRLKSAEGEESDAKRLKSAEGEESNKVEETEKIKLKTSDGVIFEVERWMAKEMVAVQNFFEDNDNDSSIAMPLPNVTSTNLGRILDLQRKESEQELLLAMLTLDELKDLLLTVNFLDMKKLLDLVAKRIANMIKNKSVEFVRKNFNIVNDFTPEEEAEIRNQYDWAHAGIACDD